MHIFLYLCTNICMLHAVIYTVFIHQGVFANQTSKAVAHTLPEYNDGDDAGKYWSASNA